MQWPVMALTGKERGINAELCKYRRYVDEGWAPMVLEIQAQIPGQPVGIGGGDCPGRWLFYRQPLVLWVGRRDREVKYTGSECGAHTVY